jgi:hypothetical protein
MPPIVASPYLLLRIGFRTGNFEAYAAAAESLFLDSTLLALEDTGFR